MTNYLEPETQKTLEFPTDVSAGLFILLCTGIDEYRKEKYRYSYSYPRKRGKNYEVTVNDYGE